MTATLRLPGHPEFAVAAPGALWVSTRGPSPQQKLAATGRLLRIDLATGTVERAVQLPGQTASLVRDGDRVIADSAIAGTPYASSNAPGELLAVSWRTGHVIARRRQQIATGPMIVGDGVLWAIRERPTLLEALSPTTLAPIAPPLALSRTSRVLGLAWGDGYVWASAADDGDLLRIDPTTRAITRVHVGGFPIGIVLTRRSVWVIDNANDTVLQLNPSSLRELGRPVHTPSGGAFYLAASDGYVFIANDANGTVTRIDARTGRTAGLPIRIAPASKGNSDFSAAYAIAAAGTTIWATSGASSTISRIQARP